MTEEDGVLAGVGNTPMVAGRMGGAPGGESSLDRRRCVPPHVCAAPAVGGVGPPADPDGGPHRAAGHPLGRTASALADDRGA